MPIFEYNCEKCHTNFELLVRGETVVQCPACSSRRVEKQLSVFAAATGNNSHAADFPVGPCGSCGDPRGPGSCSMN